MVYVMSYVDNKLYMVRNNDDKQYASNLLGNINKNINEQKRINYWSRCSRCKCCY